MTTIFFITLGVGAGFVVLSLIFGQFFGASSVSFEGASSSPFLMIFIALFLTVFGGTGLIFYSVFGNSWLALIFAGFSGLMLSYLLLKFVLMPLKRAQSTNTHEKQTMIGRSAKVTESIAAGGFGKITYIVNDKIVSGPARGEDGAGIPRDTDVDIVYIERNTYFVRQKEPNILNPN
ncbi:MAG: NfeD family protein [Defluviitaleaceae bacterium]|nr:NfeD family protein [Defluviitaleaceae bacterium]